MGKRTEAQIRAFVKECVKIEKEGGNVQEYVAREWPSYSPEATWRRLQKDYMYRKGGSIKSGLPKVNAKQKPKEDMSWRAPMKPPKMSKVEMVARALVKGAEEGKTKYEVLEPFGYKYKNSAIQEVRKWAAVNHPEWVEIINAMPNSDSPLAREFTPKRRRVF